MAEHDTNTRDGVENSRGKRLQKKAVESVLEKLGEHAVEPNMLNAIEGSLMGESSQERHAALLAGAKTDAQRASLAIHLQQTYGNQYVQRLVESLNVQAKLSVNSPDDEYEREADGVAETVTRGTASSVQRQEEEPEEEEEEKEEGEEVQAKSSESELQIVSEDLEAGINAARGSGQPLPDSVRNSIEPQLGHDFGRVQIHTDAQANKLSEQLNAEAFTTGNDIFFREDAYHPGSDSGRGLIAHELTHVVQQEGSRSKARDPARTNIQLLSVGTGASPDAGWKEVPADHKKRVEAGIGIIEKVTKEKKLINYFKDKAVPAGVVDTLKNVINRAKIWEIKVAGSLGEAFQGGSNMAYDSKIYRIGKFQIAATLLHEMGHLANFATEKDCENAMETGRVYAPFIDSVAPSKARVGQEVVIKGMSFGFSQSDVDKVEFNKVDAGKATSWTWTPAGGEIRIKVPAGATSGPLVIINNEVRSNEFAFTVLP